MLKKRRKYPRRSRKKKGPSILFKWLKRLGIFLLVFLIIVLLIGLLFNWIVKIKEPAPENKASLELKRTEVAENFYRIGNNWIRKNQSGIWEMYTEGAPFERGVINGKLSKELVKNQEVHFVSQINEMVPSGFYQSFLKYMIAWFNRDIDEFVPEEYQLEIFGVSHAASDEFSYIAPNYQRILNYHAAHDIGHALQNMSMVGCTSFGAWNEKSADSTLIIGRNFDFYVGDEFAEEKIVSFVAPDKGHKFMMITWGGMIGAVSGMNDRGLTVTMNAAKSDIPGKAATPISILGREILQYAATIDEAMAIADRTETFVSESLMIGSAANNETAIIEKMPNKTALYQTSRNYLTCSNHFQSKAFKDDPLNKENIEESDSYDRFKRINELVRKERQISAKTAADILRNQRGLGGKNIGMGNEKAVNQLIAHHSVIFKPKKLQVWVSTSPWQLGKYIAYDLGKIFSDTLDVFNNEGIIEEGLTIPVDNFLLSADYQKFKLFRSLKKQLVNAIKSPVEIELSNTFQTDFIQTNPEFYLTYSLLGDYFKKMGDCLKAANFYRKALEKEIPKKSVTKNIQDELKECTEEADA